MYKSETKLKEIKTATIEFLGEFEIVNLVMWHQSRKMKLNMRCIFVR